VVHIRILTVTEGCRTLVVELAKYPLR
jgi:hypothetical protein